MANNTNSRSQVSLFAVLALIGLSLLIMLQISSLSGNLDHALDELDSLHRQVAKLEEKIATMPAVAPVAKPLPVRPGTPTPEVATAPTANPNARRITFKGVSYDVLTADAATDNIRLFLKDPKGKPLKSFANLRLMLESKGEQLVFATNGGMFATGNMPKGLYIENSKTLNPLDLKENKNSSSNFYMTPNGVFYINRRRQAFVLESNRYKATKDTVIFATQSGPMLVHNDTIHKAFTQGSANKRIRSGVGALTAGQVIFVMSNEPVNFYDFAQLFKENFKCRNALYLDGDISKMYLPDLGREDLTGDFGPIIAITRKP